MLWLGFAVLALVALGFLLWPLMRVQHGAADRRAHDIAVYRSQLAEIDQELARGALSEAEAESARLEIQRRLLRADSAGANVGANAGASQTSSQRFVQFGSMAALVLVPLLAGGLYVMLGRPEAADFDTAMTRQQAEREAQQRQDIERMIAQLRQRLEAEPNQREGWMLLGRSLIGVQRPEEAVAAFDRAIAMPAPPALMADALSLRGEARVLAADGAVTQPAQEDFRATLQHDPQNASARYYLGLARLQEGDTRGAYDDWYGLAAEAPADAPWLPLVQARLRELAPRLNIPLAQAVPEPKPAAGAQDGQPGPSQEEMEAAQQMADDERAAMIRGMVERLNERLKENPNDADGWLRLARAREVMGEPEAAREALRKAVALQPNRVEARVALAFNLAGTSARSREPLPAEAAEEFRQVLTLAPNHAQALWFAGRAAYEAGDKATAAGHWNKLLAMLPPDSPEARELSDRIESLNR
ncbi:c-type cytochrome biogenesis protein CcmI [uncultured Ferrovibrio sp.]|jgi:cytochrome c-type biogenesis protein CcmH|uniref:c-type cytochrome biogenesis protein CcmI n=1 Tax=uncultured Ferrovibrio sp. TaxID=1576913 RepID=UPI00262399D5|nr:c-type cytochrome biogenesis protein CcmI [uncultured Ferrovibrio sp.]